MRYRIEGKDRNTGTEFAEFYVDASSKDAAAELAADLDVEVETITESPGTSEPLDESISIAAKAKDFVARFVPKSKTPPDFFRTLRNLDPSAPKYAALIIAAWAHLVIASIMIAVGVVIIIEPPGDMRSSSGLLLLLYSLPVFTIAALLHAIRGIAINSWHTRTAVEKLAGGEDK